MGLHAGHAWELTLPEPSERHQRSSQRTRRSPSRCAIPDQTELVLPSEFGIWLSQCDPVSGERMSDMRCQCEPEGGPSLVRSAKSDTLGMRGSWLSRCPEHRE